MMVWGDDIGGDEETLVATAFDRPVMVHRYPAADEGLLLQEGPGRPEGGARLRRAGAGGVRGDHRRRPARGRPGESWRRPSPQHELPREAFEWYLDLRRYGTVPHAGFGMGVERCVAWICGLHHVRETIPFARMMERITP